MPRFPHPRIKRVGARLSRGHSRRRAHNSPGYGVPGRRANGVALSAHTRIRCDIGHYAHRVTPGHHVVGRRGCPKARPLGRRARPYFYASSRLGRTSASAADRGKRRGLARPSPCASRWHSAAVSSASRGRSWHRKPSRTVISVSAHPAKTRRYAAARASLGGLACVQIRVLGARSKADWVVKHLAVDHDLLSELRFSGFDPSQPVRLRPGGHARPAGPPDFRGHERGHRRPR